ncbi:exosome complex exonuclease RRP6 [Nematocida homosporus]|uniref:exosome complex exonuclease RRP6 n=1 Tax=Nematocida homosporus TaxID=1912981 RepID=UPI00221E7A1A|nr:exosome complex exonuclease RRP6 [Nematocida homosporus]KAI5186390.1 exosome complex exonuclease RRP6 [Nematocida homosporus]
MSLNQPGLKLLKTLERYAAVIKQEELILPPSDFDTKVCDILTTIKQIEETISISDSLLIQEIEKILDTVHKTCAHDDKHKVSLGGQPKTVLFTHQDKKFILAKNIPRPQIDFKDRENKYTLTAVLGPDPVLTQHMPLTPAEAYQLYTAATQAPSLTHAAVSIIRKPEQLQATNQLLMQCPLVAIDIKKHTFRSYKGFICYLQIATPQQIYLVDMITLRDQVGTLTFLSTPSVGKVVYRLPPKRYWLEKEGYPILRGAVDLQVFSEAVVPGLSLTQMGQTYLGEHLPKQFHLLDWRYRPATQEMVSQLVQDVQTILPIFTQLASQLGLESFSHLCQTSQEYVPPTPSVTYFAQKYSIPISPALTAIFTLREFIAKQEDESPDFVLTNRQMCLLLKHLPTTPQEVFTILPKISPLFKANLNNFLRVLHPDDRHQSFSMAMLKNTTN